MALFEMSEFVSQKNFNLNFEDKTPSVRVQEGDTLQYDGENVFFTTRQGAKVEGKTKHLNGAIRTGWIVQKGSTPEQTVSETSETGSRNNYDRKIGGSFDVWSKENLASAPNPKFDKTVLGESERTVKSIGEGKSGVEKNNPHDNEVVGDQVMVKQVNHNLVTSSTSKLDSKGHSTEIVRSEQVGADRAIDLKNTPQKQKEEKERKGFLVDDTSRSLPSDATLSDVQKAKGSVPQKKNASEKREIVRDVQQQDAQVVGAIKRPNLNQTSKEGVNLKRSQAPKEMNITAKVSSGGDTVTDAMAGSEGVEIVGKTSKDVQKPDQKSSENNTVDYSDKLPEGWESLHWAKKEKFIKTLDDPDLIRFIQSIIKVPVLKKACEARLRELGK